ncbi:MAG: transposase [Gammaproteobacteria bacterium]|nr:transposase [Gammaproteobacteria bacterium]
MRKLANRFSVSLSFIWLLIQRYRQTGGVEPKAHGGGQPRKLMLYDEIVLGELVQAHPAATLMELSELLKDKTGVEVSASTIGLTLRRRGITRKKISYHATEREESEEVQQARQEFQEEQPEMEAKKLIFVDGNGLVSWIDDV